MYINVGNNLFLPEGDDYSRETFDRHAQELESQGKHILGGLREQKAPETAGDKLPFAAVVKAKAERERSSSTPDGEGNKKQTYKEIFEEIAAKK